MANPSNTVAGVNSARIAKLTLEAVQAETINFGMFTTDLSADIKTAGESVTTRFVANPTVSDFSAERSAQASSMTARTVTLSNYVGVDLGFTDLEVSKSDIELLEMYVKPAVKAIFENVIATGLALITNANFTTNTVITAANFTAGNVASLQESMNTAKVSGDGRSLIIKPTYATTLKTDSAIQAAYAYGSAGAIRDGSVPRVYGFDVKEWNGTIPTNSENLAGIALQKTALVLATRQPAVPTDWYGKVESITDPASGLTLQFRSFYDGNVQRSQLCLVHGWQKGITTNCHRILSA